MIDRGVGKGMPKSFEEILGRGPIQQERTIPGTQPGEADTVRYVSFGPNEKPAKVFRTVTTKIDPPFLSDGGCVLEGCIITLPDKTSLYPLAFHGDVVGWQRQIEGGARALGLLFGKILDDRIVLSDGREISLANCDIEFD